MAFLRQILTSFLALILVAFIALPSVLKLVHALHEHSYIECVDANSLHVHEAEVDCDFQKFKLTPQFYFVFTSYHSFNSSVSTKIDIANYNFLSNYQKLHFALRAPPVLC